MKKEYDLKKLKRRSGKVKVDKAATKTPISIRLDGADLSIIREQAERLGIPYQTFVGSILHQFAKGDLVEWRTVDTLKKLKASGR